MNLTIGRDETQRAFVERVLREEGEISAYAAMYGLRDEDGHGRGITRLAPIIETLRRAGWEIETRAAPGQQAVYRLRGVFAGRGVGRVRECPSCHRTHPVGTTCVRAVLA